MPFRRDSTLSALLCIAALGACTDQSRHATDGDSGAAAPATVIDMSATPRAGDSTAGVAAPTGRPQAAGDTMGGRGVDPKRRPNAGSPVGRP